MAVSEENLLMAKQYMRVEGNEEDLIIRSLYSAAVLYLENAGIKEPAEVSELYNLAVWSLTLHYYDHRDAVGNEASFPTGLRPIINQLKLVGEVNSAST